MLKTNKENKANKYYLRKIEAKQTVIMYKQYFYIRFVHK